VLGVKLGVVLGVILGVLLGDILGVTEGADPNSIFIHKPATVGIEPVVDSDGVGVGLVPIDGVILGLMLMLGVALTLGKGVIDGDTDTLIVGEGVILGAIVLLGVILGVIGGVVLGDGLGQGPLSWIVYPEVPLIQKTPGSSYALTNEVCPPLSDVTV
jgi:hypothetical protein